MSDLVLGTSDRGARGELRITLCVTQRGAEYVDLRHFERGHNGALTPGNGLALKVDEIETVLALLTKSKAVLASAKPAQHRTLSASEAERDLERRLF